MADLRSDTEVTGGENGHWHAKVSPDWRLWSPNGGYLATIALRAAGRESAGMRPASLHCSFLSSPQPGPVELRTTVLRRSSRAHAVRVTMAQQGVPVLEATVWSVRHDLTGLPARTLPLPDGVSAPQTLPPLRDLLPPAKRSTDPFWQHLEERVVEPAEHLTWPEVAGSVAERLTWLRFRPDPLCGNPVGADDPDAPYVDAGRSVIAVDVYVYTAAVFVLRREQITHIAPTISLAVDFHTPQPASEWLLLNVTDSVSGEGLVGGRARVWSEAGVLVASGGAQQLCSALR